MGRPELTDRERRELAVNSFETDLELARDAWLEKRVLPYVRCYGTAHAWYTHTLRQADREAANERKFQTELLIAVALIIGPEVLAMASITARIQAATPRIAAALRSLTSTIDELAGNWPTAGDAAERKLVEFMFDKAPDAAVRLFTGPVKQVIKDGALSTERRLSTPHVRTPWVGQGPPGMAPDTSMHRAWLEDAFVAVHRQLLAYAVALRDSDDPKVASIDQLRKALDELRQAPFMAQARTLEDIPAGQMQAITSDMEKAIWAFWVLSHINQTSVLRTRMRQYYGGRPQTSASDRRRGLPYVDGNDFVTPYYSQVPNAVFSRLIDLAIEVRCQRDRLRYHMSQELGGRTSLPAHLREWAQGFLARRPSQELRERVNRTGNR